MAKKVSKHSRAARRGETDSGEAKALEQLPKPENALKKSIIRSTILTENLLAKRLENKRNKKKQPKNIKTSRTTNMGGVLSTKINNSVARYNFIKNTRGVGWDKINEDIRKPEQPKEKEVSAEQQEEDEYVREFFEDEKKEEYGNKFALLGDDADA